MYYEGGIYTDIDRYCNISFDEIIGTCPPKKCILPTYLDQDFSQDLLISCKNNPIFFISFFLISFMLLISNN